MNNRDKKLVKQKLKQLDENTRFTKDELSLISNTFYERNDLLIAIRKFFLQVELTEAEETIIKGLTPQTIDLLHKQLLPEIDGDSPFYQNRDMWTSIKTEEKLAEDVFLDMKAQQIAIEYLISGFAQLSERGFWTIKLEDLVYNKNKDVEKAFTELKARNILLTHIDAYLDEIRVLAINNAKIGDEEKILKLDSNK